MAGLKAVLFDNDGTLVDSRELLLASFHYAGPAVLGRQLSDEEYLQKVGQPLAVQSRTTRTTRCCRSGSAKRIERTTKRCTIR